MRCFIDTNIFVYARDMAHGPKRNIAEQLLEETLGSANADAVINYQVIQEFCNVMLVKKGVAAREVALVVQKLLSPLVQNTTTSEFYGRVIELHGRFSLSFYDACIVQAAIDLDCNMLYTEDLQDGQSFGELKVINPFSQL